MNSQERVHFIGIGGVGMSGLAKILLQLGYRVSGSDLKESGITKGLEALGSKFYLGHRAENLGEVDRVVVSTAIPSTNPEFVKAKAENLPITHRGELLAKIMNSRKGLAVAGAHGKTTTSSMLALTLESSGLDPTIIVGGEIKEIGGTAKLGNSDLLVAEADESDGSFLKLNPFGVIITNIEDDHLDYYGSREKIFQAFQEFVDKIPPEGFAVLCFDNENVRRLAKQCHKRMVSYGLDQEAEYMVKDIRQQGMETFAKVYYHNQCLGELALNVPGKHNITNALAVIAMGREIGLDFETLVKGLKKFRGVKRRFQVLGDVNGIQVVDDYAHHPTEIKATLKAAQETKAKRVIGVFQPHRYTRTQLLWDDFGRAFSDADIIVINDIYSAGEQPIEGVSAQLIVEAIQEHEHREVVYLPTQQQITDYLADIARPGDLILTMGAGNICNAGVELVAKLRR